MPKLVYTKWYSVTHYELLKTIAVIITIENEKKKQCEGLFGNQLYDATKSWMVETYVLVVSWSQSMQCSVFILFCHVFTHFGGKRATSLLTTQKVTDHWNFRRGRIVQARRPHTAYFVKMPNILLYSSGQSHYSMWCGIKVTETMLFVILRHLRKEQNSSVLLVMYIPTPNTVFWAFIL